MHRQKLKLSIWAYKLLGISCIVLGTIGVFLPLMPTTVFILIAAWAFSRSSPALHDWLLNHRWFGQGLRDWQQHHAIPMRAKAIALLMLTASYAYTAWIFGPLSLPAIVGGICITAVILYIAHIPILLKEKKVHT